MNRATFLRWAWLALAVALVSVPAQAQTCEYDEESYCASGIDSDGYGNVAGYSITEVPYMYAMFGYVSTTEGYLTGPGISDDEWVTDYGGEGSSEADTSGVASEDGSFEQFGNHWVSLYWESPEEGEEIGESDADEDFEGTCDFPTYEDSVDANVWNGAWMYRIFTATVSDEYMTNFSGRPIYEVWGGSDNTFATSPDNQYSTCPDGTDIKALMADSSTQYISSLNTYPDAIGFYIDTVWAVIYGSAPTPCGFTDYQQMWMQCTYGPDYNYATNYNYAGVSMYPSAGNGTVVYSRGESGYAIFSFPGPYSQ